jgi:hypothetical protein
MKLGEFYAFLGKYAEMFDAEVTVSNIPSGLRVENLIYQLPQDDLFGDGFASEIIITHDNCFDGDEE